MRQKPKQLQHTRGEDLDNTPRTKNVGERGAKNNLETATKNKTFTPGKILTHAASKGQSKVYKAAAKITRETNPMATTSSPSIVQKNIAIQNSTNQIASQEHISDNINSTSAAGETKNDAPQ